MNGINKPATDSGHAAMARVEELNLVPWPRAVERADGQCRLTPATTLRLLAGTAQPELDIARLLQRAWQTSVSPADPGLAAPLVLRAAPRAEPRVASSTAGPDILLVSDNSLAAHGPEAYRLRITSGAIELAAAATPGLFYAAQTLAQLLLQFGPELPALTIEDWPALARRGVMMDLSRGKVPTLATLLGLAERFAALKYNHWQLYIEHTFAFEAHPLPGAGHSPLAPEDLIALDAHCRRLHIELVPNLQSFGHQHEFLKHDRYKALAESDFRGGWTLSPVVPEVYDLLGELYDEYLPCFTHTPEFNIDGDEPWDLAKGRGAARAAELGGVGFLYLEHLTRLHAMLTARGRRMMVWGDIIEQHPELLGKLPRDITLLHWDYVAHGREAHYIEPLRRAAQAGLTHWVCPGTDAWLSFMFRKPNARANMLGMAHAARESGAEGYLLTDWGDEGHLNTISQSYWSFAYGAECAWHPEAEPGADEAAGAAETAARARFDERWLATQLPGAPASWIQAVNLLGGLYLLFSETCNLPNSILRMMLEGEFYRTPEGEPRLRFLHGHSWPVPPAEAIEQAARVIEEALAHLTRAGGVGSELALVRREWWASAHLAWCACRRALAWHAGLEPQDAADAWRDRAQLALQVMDEVWRARNRESDWPRLRASIERSLGLERPRPAGSVITE